MLRFFRKHHSNSDNVSDSKMNISPKKSSKHPHSPSINSAACNTPGGLSASKASFTYGSKKKVVPSDSESCLDSEIDSSADECDFIESIPKSNYKSREVPKSKVKKIASPTKKSSKTIKQNLKEYTIGAPKTAKYTDCNSVKNAHISSQSYSNTKCQNSKKSGTDTMMNDNALKRMRERHRRETLFVHDMANLITKDQVSTTGLFSKQEAYRKSMVDLSKLSAKPHINTQKPSSANTSPRILPYSQLSNGGSFAKDNLAHQTSKGGSFALKDMQMQLVTPRLLSFSVTNDDDLALGKLVNSQGYGKQL